VLLPLSYGGGVEGQAALRGEPGSPRRRRIPLEEAWLLRSLAEFYDRALTAAFAFAKPLEQLDLTAPEDGLASLHLCSRGKREDALPDWHDARTRRDAGASHRRYLLSGWLGG
jgi:hypothetical protein